MSGDQHFTTADGCRIAYRIDGPVDRPVLMLSNSIATNLHMWDRSVAALGRSFRLLRYDTRGHGGSDAPAGPYSMDRLGRDARDLYAIVDELTAKGCAVQFVSERITVDKSGTSPVDGLMLGILAAFAEFERRRIKERQAEGIALAKARGKYVQAPKLSDTDVEQARVMIEMGIPKAEVARTFGVSRQTLYTSLRRQASD